MKIGIDFDNTIVCYDEAFYLTAFQKKLIPKNFEKSKDAIRNYLRSIDKENEWTKLQGYVYGKKMNLAQSFKGINFFFFNASVELFIISHKTLYPYEGPKYDLHQSAYNWIKQQPFFKKNLKIFFELTLKDKLKKIADMKCDYFIDDLPEILTHPDFPTNTKKILFDPQKKHTKISNIISLSSWLDIFNFLLI